MINSFKRTAELENRFVCVTSPLLIDYIYKKTYRSGWSSITTADEDVSKIYLGFVIHISLKDIVWLKLSQIHEAGIFSWRLKRDHLETFKTNLEEIGPQVLTLTHLKAGFVVIFVLLAVSVVAFVAECAPMLMKKVKSQLKNLFDACLSCYVVVKFNRMKRML
jgi:hypothetical protein